MGRSKDQPRVGGRFGPKPKDGSPVVTRDHQVPVHLAAIRHVMERPASEDTSEAQKRMRVAFDTNPITFLDQARRSESAWRQDKRAMQKAQSAANPVSYGVDGKGKEPEKPVEAADVRPITDLIDRLLAEVTSATKG